MISLQKHSSLNVHQDHPLNAGSPPDVARKAFITPQERFFVRNHGAVPEVDIQNYRLVVSGKVQSPLELSLDELRTYFPTSTVMATLQCAGHRRDELAAISAIPGEILWGAETVGNAIWQGVALRDVLLAAGIDSAVQHVAFVGLDEIQKGGETFGFGGSIPIEKALSSEVILAYAMNNEPLSPTHGYPLRVVVPGYIGARSVKWLQHVILQDHPSTNYYQTHAYKLFPPHIRADTVNWAEGQMLGELPLNTVICSPQEDAKLSPGQVHIKGYTLAGDGYGIEQVELSIDEGKTWLKATLLEKPSAWAWYFWEASLHLPAGSYQLLARVWNASARTQPADAEEIWDFKGYLNNAWHKVNITIQ